MELEILSAIRGHTTMYIDDVRPEERAKLGETVTNLLREGHAIFLVQGVETRRVQGYDAATNEWLVLATPHARRAAAALPDDASKPRMERWRGARAMAIAPSAGG